MEDQAREEELRALARELFAQGAQMMRLRPNVDVRDSVRGLPAVMTALCETDEPLSPSELARITGVSDARIANILRVLEERGCVLRRASVGDRRRVEVLATERGRAEESRRRAAGERFVMEFLDELGIDDARDLVRVISRVNEVMVDRRAEGRDVCAAHAREDGMLL